MGNNTTHVNTGGGSLNMTGSAIGSNNTVSGNTFNTSEPRPLFSVSKLEVCGN
jgi:hypothetical protein